jgi:hypothetical protein
LQKLHTAWTLTVDANEVSAAWVMLNFSMCFLSGSLKGDGLFGDEK